MAWWVSLSSQQYYLTLTPRSDPSYGSLARDSGRTYERKSGELNRQDGIDVHLTIATGVRTVCHQAFTIAIATVSWPCVYVSPIRSLNPTMGDVFLPHIRHMSYVHTVVSRILALVVILLRLSTPGISSHRSCTCPSQQLPLALSDPGGFLLLTRYHGMDNGVVHE